MRRLVLLAALVAGLSAIPHAQPVFRGSEIFPPEEFAARRTKLMAQIGDAVAIVLGTTEPPGEMPIRQNSQFFYLTGVNEPRSYVIIDGRTKKTTLFLPPKNEQREKSMYGPALSPGPEAIKDTGVDETAARTEFTAAVTAVAADHRTIFTPFGAEVLGSQSFGDPSRLWRTNKQDPWDGRDSREATFIEKLKAAAPQSEIKDLDPVINAMRAYKSPREIAIIREATRIAGLGIMEAMRDARPGMFEYELQADAEFVFTKYGAYGPSYFALIGAGPDTYYTHYHKNTGKLVDGDLVQFDYAPDYKYYQSDVTRVFPVNGKFTPRQREMYVAYLRIYQAVMTSIKPHVPVPEIVKDAVKKMDDFMATYRFTDEKIRAAATAMVNRYKSQAAGGRGNSLGHNVGLEVHDVGGGAGATTLEPGRIFTIEPQFRIEDEHLGIRLEDMILITETGYENMSAFVPIEVADIETLMAEPGLSDAQVKIKKGRP